MVKRNNFDHVIIRRGCLPGREMGRIRRCYQVALWESSVLGA